MRHKYETDCSYEEPLQYTRMVESEKNESSVSESVPAKATKFKASSAQQQQPSQQPQQKGNSDLVRLEKAYRSCQGELAKMQKHLQQIQEIKTSWDASAFQSSTETTPKQIGGSGGNSNHSPPQSNQNSSPQNSGQYPNQNYNSGSRGYRGRGSGRGYGPERRQTPTPPGKPEGWNIDFVSGVETLLHLIRPIIPSNNALTIKKLEKIGGTINSKHLHLNLLPMLLKTPPLRETSKESI